MTTVVFTNSSWGLPVINELFKMNCLKGVVIPYLDHSDNRQVEEYAREYKIPLFKIEKNQLKYELEECLSTLMPDVVFCMTFPYLIPKTILDIPPFGFINFHFGKLPEYGGPDPIFWHLKEGKKKIIITAHRMGVSFDVGQLVDEKEVAIIPGENWGILGSRLSLASVSMISPILNKLQKSPKTLPEIANNITPKSINPKSLQIDWAKQNADEIEALVNACNPKYGGAVTYFRSALVRILEVSPADVSNATSFSPGSIVFADAQHGIFVLCSDYKFLRINILNTVEGYMTGQKLVALGVRTNEKFNTEEANTNKKETTSDMLLQNDN